MNLEKLLAEAPDFNSELQGELVECLSNKAIQAFLKLLALRSDAGATNLLKHPLATQADVVNAARVQGEANGLILAIELFIENAIKPEEKTNAPREQ